MDLSSISVRNNDEVSVLSMPFEPEPEPAQAIIPDDLLEDSVGLTMTGSEVERLIDDEASHSSVTSVIEKMHVPEVPTTASSSLDKLRGSHFLVTWWVREDLVEEMKEKDALDPAKVLTARKTWTPVHYSAQLEKSETGKLHIQMFTSFKTNVRGNTLRAKLMDHPWNDVDDNKQKVSPWIILIRKPLYGKTVQKQVLSCFLYCKKIFTRVRGCTPFTVGDGNIAKRGPPPKAEAIAKQEEMKEKIEEIDNLPSHIPWSHFATLTEEHILKYTTCQFSKSYFNNRMEKLRDEKVSGRYLQGIEVHCGHAGTGKTQCIIDRYPCDHVPNSRIYYKDNSLFFGSMNSCTYNNQEVICFDEFPRGTHSLSFDWFKQNGDVSNLEIKNGKRYGTTAAIKCSTTRLNHNKVIICSNNMPWDFFEDFRDDNAEIQWKAFARRCYHKFTFYPRRTTVIKNGVSKLVPNCALTNKFSHSVEVPLPAFHEVYNILRDTRYRHNFMQALEEKTERNLRLEAPVPVTPRILPLPSPASPPFLSLVEAANMADPLACHETLSEVPGTVQEKTNPNDTPMVNYDPDFFPGP